MGWTFMALLDVLEEMPQDHPKRPELVKIFRSFADGIIKAQDTKTGIWYQVLDEPGREGNYLEGTATAMYVYSLLRGVRMGILDDSYLNAALTGWNGMNKHPHPQGQGRHHLADQLLCRSRSRRFGKISRRLI